MDNLPKGAIKAAETALYKLLETQPNLLQGVTTTRRAEIAKFMTDFIQQYASWISNNQEYIR